MRILVADDDRDTANAIAEVLHEDGHTVSVVADGRDALSAFTDFAPDLVVLDLMLPRLDGMSVCLSLRAMSSVPILVASARTSTFDRVIALRSGADDYIAKPFDMEELRARASAILRRAARTPHAERIVVGDLELDHRLMSATVHGRDLLLTAAEYRIVSELVASRDVVVPSARLAAVSGTPPEGRGVAVHIARIRHKLADAGASLATIETARGFGYRCTETTASAAA